jgi:hypothetical protein
MECSPFMIPTTHHPLSTPTSSFQRSPRQHSWTSSADRQRGPRALPPPKKLVGAICSKGHTHHPAGWRASVVVRVLVRPHIATRSVRPWGRKAHKGAGAPARLASVACHSNTPVYTVHHDSTRPINEMGYIHSGRKDGDNK